MEKALEFFGGSYKLFCSDRVGLVKHSYFIHLFFFFSPYISIIFYHIFREANFPSTFAQSSNGEIFALIFCNKEYSQSELFFYMIHLPQYISFRIIFLAFFFSFYRVSLVERCIRSLKVMKPSSHFFNIQPLTHPLPP